MQQKTCQKLPVSLQKPTIKPVKIKTFVHQNLVFRNAMLHPKVSDFSKEVYGFPTPTKTSRQVPKSRIYSGLAKENNQKENQDDGWKVLLVVYM